MSATFESLSYRSLPEPVRAQVYRDDEERTCIEHGWAKCPQCARIAARALRGAGREEEP